jgi:hypothetical protein
MKNLIMGLCLLVSFNVFAMDGANYSCSSTIGPGSFEVDMDLESTSEVGYTATVAVRGGNVNAGFVDENVTYADDSFNGRAFSLSVVENSEEGFVGLLSVRRVNTRFSQRMICRVTE